MSGIVVKVDGVEEARELLEDLSGRELENRVRRGTRAGAAIFRAKVRAEAKGRSDLPDSFAKTRTRSHRNPVGTSTGPTSPLLNIFEGGAGAHPISPDSAAVMAGPGGERWRSRGFFSAGTVQHPGMGARPLIGPIFDAHQDQASEAAMDEVLRGLR